MKLTLFPVLALACGLAGCSGVQPHGGPVGPEPGPSQITGNWEMTATSTATGTAGTVTPFSIYLTASNGAISGTLFPQATYPVIATCIFPSELLTGTVDAQGNISMQSTAGGPAFTLTGLAASGTVTGTYALGSGCSAGTVTGIEVPALNGTYSGTMTSVNNGRTINVTTTLSQSSTTNDRGILSLSGTVSFSGTPCLANLTIGTPASQYSGLDGYALGVTFVNASGAEASLVGSISNDARTLTLDYSVGPNGGCSYDFGKGTLTLQ